MADARALVSSKHEANFEEEAHVSDEMLAKLSDPLAASETSPAQKAPKEVHCVASVHCYTSFVGERRVKTFKAIR